MNNLHRELAPISAAAWEEIETEASRSFKRNVAGRRVVDVVGPLGLDAASVGASFGASAVIAGVGSFMGKPRSSNQVSYARTNPVSPQEKELQKRKLGARRPLPSCASTCDGSIASPV